MKNQVIGIDISKDKMDFCLLDQQTLQVLGKGEIENHEKAIKKWLSELSISRDSLFALEHTGHYGTCLVKLLSEQGYTFYLLNTLEIKRSIGVQRGKSDAKDAYRIAEYIITNRHKVKPYQLAAENLNRLKVLLTARERFVKMSVQVQNSLKANEIINKSVDVKMVIKEEKKQYEALKKSIKAIEHEMQTIVQADQEFKNSYKQATSVIGVGPIIAIKCIVETDNFTKFQDPRKFSCHCGLAPFQYQSGSSIRGKTKTHFLRDKSLKAILTKGAITAVQHDPQIKAYYNRKIQEGKHPMSVINAVANKLVLRIFAVTKRETPFVKLVA